MCRDPAPATGWGTPPGPDPMRRDLPSPVPTVRSVGGVFHLRAGRGRPRVAAVGDLPIAALGPSRGRGYVALGAISRSDRGSQHAPEAGDGRLGARRTT